MMGKHAVGSFRLGATTFFRGQRYVFVQHPQLLAYCAIPMAIGMLVSAGLVLLFFLHFDSLLQWLWSRPDSWWLQMIWYVFSAVTFLLSLATTLLISFLIFMIVSAPFNDLLSEQVEALEGTFETRPFALGFVLRDAWYAVSLELLKVMHRLLWLVPLYIVSLLVPVAGQLLYVLVGGYKMSLSLGMEYVDWSLSRRGYSATERLTFASAQRWSLFGFGLMMTLCSLIPLGAILVWPGAVAGGTLLCAGLTAQDRRKGGTGDPACVPTVESQERL